MATGLLITLAALELVDDNLLAAAMANDCTRHLGRVDQRTASNWIIATQVENLGKIYRIAYFALDARQTNHFTLNHLELLAARLDDRVHEYLLPIVITMFRGNKTQNCRI